MFREVVYPDWAAICTVVAFVIVLAVFIAMVVRAVRMPKKEVERMSEMPLKDSTPRDAADNGKTSSHE